MLSANRFAIMVTGDLKFKFCVKPVKQSSILFCWVILQTMLQLEGNNMPKGVLQRATKFKAKGYIEQFIMAPAALCCSIIIALSFPWCSLTAAQLQILPYRKSPTRSKNVWEQGLIAKKKIIILYKKLYTKPFKHNILPHFFKSGFLTITYYLYAVPWFCQVVLVTT